MVHSTEGKSRGGRAGGDVELRASSGPGVQSRGLSPGSTLERTENVLSLGSAPGQLNQ